MKSKRPIYAKKAICSKCHNLRPVYYSITIDCVPHHFCEQCQQSQKAEFMQKLAAGDPDTRRIYEAVVNIVMGDKKQ